MSSEELKHGMSDNTETGSNDEHGFSEWVESITASQDALKILVAHPDYSLYQAKEHVREGKMEAKMVSRPRNGILKFLSRLDGRYMRGWKQLMMTFTTIRHHTHLLGRHETHG